MLTKLEKIPIRMAQLGFFYLPHFPLEWNLQTFQLEPPAHSKKFPQILFVALTTIYFLYGIASLYVCMHYFIFQNSIGIKSHRIVFIAMEGIAATCLPLVIPMITHDAGVLFGFNQINLLRVRLIEAFPSKANASSILEIGLIPLVFGILLSPYVVASASFVTKIDPYFHLLKCFLNVTSDSELEEDYWHILLFYRIIMCIGFLEGGRTGCHVVIAATFLCTSFIKCLSILANEKSLNALQLLRYHTRVIMAFRQMEKPLVIGISMILTSFFISFVIFAWVFINHSDKISEVGFYWLLVLASSTIGAILSAIKQIGVLNELSKESLKNAVKKARFNIVRNGDSQKSGEFKCAWKTAVAAQPLLVPYYPCLAINKKFVLSYSSTIKDKVIDAIIAF